MTRHSTRKKSARRPCSQRRKIHLVSPRRSARLRNQSCKTKVSLGGGDNECIEKIKTKLQTSFPLVPDALEKKDYTKLLFLVHPDRNIGCGEDSAKAFQTVNAFKPTETDKIGLMFT